MDSPLRNLCYYFAARYIGHGDVFPQTLADFKIFYYAIHILYFSIFVL